MSDTINTERGKRRDLESNQHFSSRAPPGQTDCTSSPASFSRKTAMECFAKRIVELEWVAFFDFCRPTTSPQRQETVLHISGCNVSAMRLVNETKGRRAMSVVTVASERMCFTQERLFVRPLNVGLLYQPKELSSCLMTSETHLNAR